jgi:hypothetical protein
MQVQILLYAILFTLTVLGANLFLSDRFGKSDLRVITYTLAGVVALCCGMNMLLSWTVATFQNESYQAAHGQGLVTATRHMGWEVYTTKPCEVVLSFNKDGEQLRIKGTDKLATPEVIKAICASK